MKQMRLIIIAIFLHSICSAQESKIPGNGTPSYAETIEWLKIYFANPSIKNGGMNGGFMQRSIYIDKLYKVVDLVFDNCLLTVKFQIETNKYQTIPEYKRIVGPEVESVSNIIDLSRVEEMVLWQHGDEGYYVFGLSFNHKGQVPKNQMDLPFLRIAGQPNIGEIKNTQVYKAFNHLRKLCGAPEPIKF